MQLKWVRVALGNLALLATLALLFEGATRLVGVRFPALASPGASDRGLWQYDEVLGWSYRPGGTGVGFMGGPDRAEIRIGPTGFRGTPAGEPALGGEPLVAVLGDSFALGLGVDAEHTFAARLQDLLREDLPRSTVLNFGVSGYSTDQELLLYRDTVSRLNPRVVILIMCDNDFEGNLETFAYGVYNKPRFVGSSLMPENVPVPKLTPAQEARLWLGRHSNLWNAFRSRRSQNGAVRRVLSLFEVRSSAPSSDDPVRLMARILTEFKEMVESRNGKFVTLNTGHRGEKTPLFQALRPLLRSSGIAFLGLEANLAEARRAKPGGLWDFHTDTHWNVDSNDLAARVVRQFLKEKLNDTLATQGKP